MTFGLLQAQIDRIARSLRITETRISSSGKMGAQPNVPIYSEVIEVISDTGSHEGKAKQVYYDLDTSAWVDAANGWTFDEDDTDSPTAQTNIYSDAELEVGDIGEVVDFQDNTERERWYFKKAVAGGAQRPIIKTAGTLAFGATLESIISQTIKNEFTEAQQFLAYYPWGTTIALPDNYVFTADVDSSGAYYTEVFPQDIYVKPLESYPAAAGFDDFQIYAGATDTSTLLFDSTISNPNGFKLILADFDFANASQAEKDYYEGIMFPVSFSVEDQDFYFISPVIGD
jgi:hypothetical protein